MCRTALIVLASAAAATVAAPATALAAKQKPLRWTRPARISNASLTSVSCPSTQLCVAAGWSGRILRSTSPLGGGRTWRSRTVAPGELISSLTCPSTSLCVGSTTSGDIVTSTNPGRARPSWTRARVDTAISVGASNPTGLNDIACPSTHLCVAVDSAGNELSSTNPAGGATSWRLTHIDGGTDYECYHYGGSGPGCQPGLIAVSCPSTSFCVSVDDAGNVAASQDPGAAQPTWTGFDPYAAADVYDTGLACPSRSLCVAGDSNGDVFTWDPSDTSPVRTSAPLDLGGEMIAMSCPFSHLCFTADDAGDLFAATNPTTGLGAWKLVLADAFVTSVSCPTLSFCVAVGTHGGVRVASRASPN